MRKCTNLKKKKSLGGSVPVKRNLRVPLTYNITINILMVELSRVFRLLNIYSPKQSRQTKETDIHNNFFFQFQSIKQMKKCGTSPEEKQEVLDEDCLLFIGLWYRLDWQIKWQIWAYKSKMVSETTVHLAHGGRDSR